MKGQHNGPVQTNDCMYWSERGRVSPGSQSRVVVDCEPRKDGKGLAHSRGAELFVSQMRGWVVTHKPYDNNLLLCSPLTTTCTTQCVAQQNTKHNKRRGLKEGVAQHNTMQWSTTCSTKHIGQWSLVLTSPGGIQEGLDGGEPPLPSRQGLSCLCSNMHNTKIQSSEVNRKCCSAAAAFFLDMDLDPNTFNQIFSWLKPHLRISFSRGFLFFVKC